MGATTRVARLAALGHKRHSKPIYNMMSIKLPRPQYVVSGLIFLAIPPLQALAKSTPYRSKTNLPTSKYKSDSMFLTIPPALNSPRSLSQSPRRSDFDLQYPLKFRPSLFSPFHPLFQLAKKSSKAAQLPLLERKTPKFASPNPQIHSKTPPLGPKTPSFFLAIPPCKQPPLPI